MSATLPHFAPIAGRQPWQPCVSRAGRPSVKDQQSSIPDGDSVDDDHVEDHQSPFGGSGFSAARWSSDDLPDPVEPDGAAGAAGAAGDAWDAPADEWMPEPDSDSGSDSLDHDEEAMARGAQLSAVELHGDPRSMTAAELDGEPVPGSWSESASEPTSEPTSEPVPISESAPRPARPAAGSIGAASAGAEAPLPGDVAAEAFDYPSFELPQRAAAVQERPATRRNGGRIVPHDLNAERCVLGALLLTPDRLVEVSEICKPDDFFDRRNRIVYECMITVDQRSQAVDAVTLIATLRATNTLAEIGGVSYLAEVTSSVSTSAHVKHHASLVSQTAKLRGLIDASNGIIERAFETPPDIEEVQTLIDESEAAIFSIAAKGETRGAAGVGSILDEVFHSIEAQRDRGEFTGIPSGFYELDDMLGGFNPGEMTVIAARPAMGKTAFVLNIMDHAATHQADCLGYEPSVLFFSLEMGRASIVQRMLVARAGVEAHRLRSGRLHDREYADLVEAAGVLKNARLFIDDTPGLSIMALRSRARRLKAEHGLDMIVIDYLQLLSAKAESRQQEISMISRSLKELSRELEVPLLTLAQLSRSVESRENKRPQLSDLRESGSIEQDADVVMMLFREEYYAPTDENKGKAEAIIVKHRNGATGDVGLQFQGAMLRFSNREPSMAEPIAGL